MGLHKFVPILGLALWLGALGACGGEDEGTGFVVLAKVRGLNLAAMSQLQVRFEATGEDRFGSASGAEEGVDYATEDGGRVFTATTDAEWINAHRQQPGNEFQIPMPFVNPDSGGTVNLHVLIHRDVEGTMVLVGESALTPILLPATAGSQVEVVVGCVRDAPCGAEVP